MDNKWTKKCAFTLFFCVFCLSLCGQNIQKKYLFKAQEKGSLYHLLPVTLFEDEEGEGLSYDLTYTSWNDTITMNFTYIKEEPLMADSIRYVFGEDEIAGKAVKLYVKPTSNKWAHRYSLTTRADGFFRIYNAVDPQIIICSKGRSYMHRIKKTNWHKYAPIGQKIFKMIHLQK